MEITNIKEVNMTSNTDNEEGNMEIDSQPQMSVV